MLLQPAIFLICCIQLAAGASCGSSGIPFRFEVMPDGHPVLGCASPICFGTESGGQNVMYDSQFNTKPYGVDGFFREGDLDRPRSRFPEAPAQLTDCPSGFSSKACNEKETWVGGINVNDDEILEVQCCKYEGMKFSTEVGRPIVRPGEVYSGGEVIRDGRQTGFDLICNVRQIPESYGKSGFQLTVCRMSCIPDPVEETNDVDIDEQEDINRILDKVHDPTSETQPLSPLPVETNVERPVPITQGGLEPNYQGSNPRYQQPTVEHVQGTETDQVVQIGESVVPVQTGGGYYYPVAGGEPACFSADTTVKTLTGEVAMKDLQVGELVMTKFENTTAFTEIITFMHLLPDQHASFVKIETADGNVLKLTPLHFIYKTSCSPGTHRDELIYAEDLGIGDCLYTISNGNPNEKVKIINLSVIEQTGIYAPMTSTGDLYTNNILSSCYNVIRSNTLSHTFFTWLNRVHKRIGSIFNNELVHNVIVELPTSVQLIFNTLADIIPK